MRVAVVSARLTRRRRDLFRRLTAEPAELVFLGPESVPEAGPGFDAVVIDGPVIPPSPGALEGLRAAVERGASLLAIGAAPPGPDPAWADLLGATACPAPAAGEYYARVAPGASPLTVRMPAEFAIVDCFAPLEPRAGAEVLVDVSVALRDRAAVVARALGAGQVVTCGLGNTDEALGTAELARLLARALRPARERRGLGRNVGVGIVGYGPLSGMGYHHGLGTGRTAGLELVAVVDPNVERRKAAEADFPGVRTYAALELLLDDEDVEVAFVATPPAQHVPLSLALLAAGKHVACEKPLCLTTAEADRLIAAAAAADRVLTVHQNRRWDPDFAAIRRAAGAGLLGEVFNVETFVGGYAHPCRTWHSEVSVSGGAAYDWGSHHIDWILQLLGGGPREVRTHGHKRVWHDVTNLDQLRVRLHFADGREAEFLQSDIAAVRRPKFYVQGTAGTLVGHYRPIALERIEPGLGYVRDPLHHAEAPADLFLARYESGYGLTETRLPPAPEQPFAFHRNLADHLHLGEPLAVTPTSVRQVVAVLEAAHRSSEDGGRPVVLEAVGD
jgi:predicted dehydrogenase